MKKVLFLMVMMFVSVLLNAQTIVFSESFDPPSNADSVTATGASSNFAINSRLFYSGTQCDTTLVSPNDTAYLTTNSFSTVGMGYVFLNFSHICKIELLDGGEVEISINNGPWTKLTGTEYVNPGNSQFVNNGNKFNSNTYPIEWLPTQSAVKPTQTWWKNESFNISGLAGNQTNVRIRFALRDGNGNGAGFNHGWYIDNIKVTAAISELVPPTITLKPPVVQDTLCSTGPFDIFAWIKDASGIDTAYIIYKVNNGPNQYTPMIFISDSTYKGVIPSFSYGTRIDYNVVAVDNSASHNINPGSNKWFYIKNCPSFVQIGNGTLQNYFYGPIYRSSASSSIDYSKYFYVITAAELAAAGVPIGAPITKLEWYKTDANATTGNATFAIWMKNSTSTGYAGPTAWSSLISGATQVYNSTTQTIPGTIGWIPFNITPFIYTGGAIEIGTDWNISAVAGNPATGVFNFQYTSGYPSIYTLGNASSTPITANLTNVTYGGTLRPNVKIYYSTSNGNNNAGVTQITSPTANQLANVNIPVDIIIKNYGTDSLKKATIQWKLDGVLQTPYTWIGALPEAVSSASFNIGSVNVGIGSHNIKVWTTLPNDSIDDFPANDTANISFYACTAGLSGVYTVGGVGADYPTFDDVMIALNNCGVNGPVTFKINSGTYNNQLTFNEIFGVSATNTITFMPNTGATVVITNNSATSTIKLNGADYITFNGSNNGTSSQDMSIINTSTAATTAAVWLASTAANNGAQNNVFKNCIIQAGSNTVTNFGIVISGSTMGSNGYDNDNNLIENNSISKAYRGIWASGSAASNPGMIDNLQIKKNIVGSSTAANYIGHDGIMVGNGSGIVIEKNTVFNIITTVTTPTGISLLSGTVNTSVVKNNVNNIAYTATGGYGGRGLYVNPMSASSNILVANNIIYQIGGDGYTSFANSSPVGMYFDGTIGGINIYYNSVYMSGNLTYNAATQSTAILFNTSTITGVDLRNNIFQNSMVNTASTTAKNYAIYSIAPAGSFTNINYNDYYVTGTQGVLGFMTSDRTTLVAWKTATGQDVNSMNVNPAFLSTTNLRTFSSDINAHGTPVAAVTDDIEDNPRNTQYPDLGAYEFNIAAKNISLVSVLQPVSSCSLSAAANVTVRVKNVGSSNIDTAYMFYKVNNGAPVQEMMIHTINPDSLYNYTFTTPVNLSAPGNYTFKVYAQLNGDTTHFNDTIQNYTIYSGYNFNASNYTQGFESGEFFGDWSILDVNADNNTWTMPFTGTTTAHSGTNSVRLYNGGTNPGNDWLFSRCFSLTGGSTYKIEFWYMASSATSPQIIDLKAGSTATPAGMTNNLLSLVAFTNTAYQKATATFTPSTSGTYYFGWWGHSAANSNYAYVDDINISLVPPQEATLKTIVTPNTGCGLSASEVVSIVIKNTGATAILGNLTASYKVDNGTVYSQPVTNTLQPGDTLLMSFTQTANLSVTTTDQTFNIKAWIALPNDPMTFNDTLNKPVTSYHLPAPPIVSNQYIPWGTSTTIHAISPDSVFWYNAPTGGTQLAISHHYTTPVLFSNTVYWAEAAIFTPNIISTIGTGTNQQGWPFYTFYMDSKTQMLYTASEIIAAGGGAGSIDKIAFNIASVGSPAMNAFTVQMQNTNLTSLTGFVNAGWTTVFTSSSYTPSGTGWQDITLQTPFFYDGASNLLINICFDNSSYTSNTMVYCSATTGKVWHEHQDLSTSSGCTALVAGTVQTDRPNIRLNQSAKGCSSARVADTVFMALFPDDANLLTNTEPVDACSGSPEHVTIRFRNNGTNTINSLVANYKVNNAAVVSETVNTTVLPGDSLTYTFNTTFNSGLTSTNVDSVYHILTYLTLTGDANHANDTLHRNVTLYYVPSPPAVTNTTIPYGTSTTLTVSTPDSVSWYATPTGGTPLSTTHSYTTPLLYTNTVYYVEALNFSTVGPQLYSYNTAPIGTGVTTQGWPFYTFYMDSRTQMLYTATELNAAGAAAGNITKIAFNVQSAASQAMNGFTIQMQSTNATSLTGFVSGGWTTVYTANYTVPGTGWQDITLQSPFFWDGTSNILINICFDNSSYTSNSLVYCTAATGMVWHEHQDLSATSGCDALTLGTVQSDRPNIRFNFSANGCASSRVPDTVFIALLPDEAGIVSMPVPVNSCVGNTQDIKLRIRNNGSNTINSFTANYIVNGAPVVTETVNTPVLSGDTLNYTFISPLVPGLSSTNQDSTYVIKAFISLTGDPMQTNDTLVKTVTLLYTPPPPTVTNTSIPYGTTATIHAVSTDSIKWWSAPTGGTLLSGSSYYTTPVLYNTTVYWAEAISGSPEIKITEVTHYSIGTGATVNQPSYIIGSDFIELANVGSADINLQNYTMNIYGAGARTYTMPSVVVPAGQVVVLHAGTGTDSPANLFYNMGGGNDIISSGSISGFALKDPTGVVVDAVASNGYTFVPADGVSATDWSGNILNMSGFAGSIRIASDNNTSQDWAISSVAAPQTLGTMNPTLSGGGSGSGCPSTRVPDTVFVSGVPPCDMSVQNIKTPNSGTLLSTTEIVRVRVKNFGSAAASNVPVSYKLNNLAPVTEIIAGPIASNDTLLYTFLTPVNLSAFGNYSLKVYTGLVCDSTYVNDTLVKTITNNPLIYCNSIPTSVIDEEIFSVTLNGSTNNYDCSTVAPGPNSILNRYSNFTTLPPLTTLSMGIAAPFSIEQDECNGAPYYANGIGIWIDLNRDGDFVDAGEQVFVESITATGPRIVNGTITVPNGSFVGITTMRIICAEGYAGALLTPCMSYSYGETEDYSIRIAPPIPKDAGVIGFSQPTTTENEGASVPVIAYVKNFGTDTIKNSSNMTVAYSYNGGIPQSIIWNGGNIAPLAIGQATLPNLTILANSHLLCGWTVLPGDTNTFNDSTCININGIPQLDAGVTTFIAPATQLVQGSTETVQIIFKNHGVDTLTSLNLCYKVNAGAPVTEPWTGTLLPGASAVYTFTQTFVVPSSSFNLCAYTSLLTDANHSNDTLCMTGYGLFTSTLPYYDNFDGPVVNFTETNNNVGTAWELGTPAYGATNSTHSAPNAWDVNLNSAYTGGSSAVLYTQNFDFSTAVSAKMKFWYNYYVENNYEGVRVDYSTDNGTTWQVLGTQNDPLGVNWYNSAGIFSSGTPNLPGWTNNSNGWKECEYKLNILNNVPLVRFRFVFTADPSVNYDGFSIDDFSITIPSDTDAGVIAINEPIVQAPAGSQKTVKVRIKNFGIDTLTSIPVSYAINGGTAVTETWTGQLAPDSTAVYNFTAQATIPAGAFSLCAYTGLVSDGDHLNDTTCSTITGVPTFIVPYSDNFEGNVYFFTNGNLWQWGVPNAPVINAAYSPTHAWVTNLTGNYPNNATEYLYSPIFNFTTVDSAYLDFYHWYHTQGNLDGGNIQYTTNGTTWITLGVQNDPLGLNWYNTNAGGVVCWSGNSNGYVHSRYRLTGITAIMNSTSAQFRFKFFSDASTNNFEGWAVDNFQVVAPPIPNDAGVTAILQPNGATQTGAQITVQVTITNFGTNTLTSIPVRYCINQMAVVNETWTGSLAPSASTNYTFTTTYPSPGTQYELCAFTKLTGDSFWWNDTTCANYSVTPGAKDVGVISILTPGDTTFSGQQYTVTVKFKNFGFNTETNVPLIYQININPVGAGNWTGTLLPGDTASFTFTQQFTSPLGNYSLCAKTQLVGDVNAANDEFCKYPKGFVDTTSINDYQYDVFALMQNNPNPGNQNVSIDYYLPVTGKVLFELVDVMGKAIIIRNIEAVAGKNSLELDVTALSDGVYFYSVTHQDKKLTKRMLIAR